MSGVPSGTLATLPIGGWVIGDLSPTGSDIINILDWYRPTGEKMSLSVSCKVSVTNLAVTEYTETLPPVDPPIEPPVVDTFPPYIPVGATMLVRVQLVDGGVWSEQYVFKRTA